jgi:glycosyltransferase involved in cell wall biosynthesis
MTNLYPNPYQPQRATFNRDQLRMLAQRCGVRVIAPILWTDELAVRLRQGARLPPGRSRILDGIVVEHPPYWFPPRILRKSYGHCYRESVRAAFRRAVDQFRPDLIFAPWAYPDGWAAVELAAEAGLPVVVKVHGSDVLLMDEHPGRSSATAEALRRADAVLAVSRDLADRVVALGAERARVRLIYDGIDLERFSPGSTSRAREALNLDPELPVILSVGNLVPVKGHDILVEACARLTRQGVRFVCHVIGQGPCRAALLRQAARLGLANRFHLAGTIPHDRLPDWFRAADVFALPSHSEGVPTVLLESAACGTPFVASRVGGIPEIAGIGPCRLTPPGDPQALADSLHELLRAQPGRDVRPAGAVRSRSETVGEMERLFAETLKSRSGNDTASEPAQCRSGEALITTTLSSMSSEYPYAR